MFTKKATIGNFIKKCFGKFYTQYIMYAYDKFQSEFIFLSSIGSVFSCAAGDGHTRKYIKKNKPDTGTHIHTKNKERTTTTK